MYELLASIKEPENLKSMNIHSLDALCGEIREFLIDSVMKTGGHFASNLGVVELTVALHYVFSVPQDSLVWDVGHQAYVHKLLTGRQEGFSSLRKFGGLSGFPKSEESPYDCFNTGHSSTAISAALGLAAAKTIRGEKGESIAVVGDAAFPGGPSLEALNHIAHCKEKVIIVLNDNQMSIGSVDGGFSRYLNKIRTRASYYTVKRETSDFLLKLPLVGKPSVSAIKKIKRLIKYAVTPGVVFEKLGLRYLGPVDGHNLRQLIDTLEEAKRQSDPVLIHVLTKKGKGYAPAEESPENYHAVSPKKSEGESFSARFGKTMVALAADNPSLIALSPSMPVSCGLGDFMKKYPDRFFDTGIAEAHAATMAAALAKGGAVPVLAVYSSFLQRAFDALIHDAAIGGLHVVFAVDRAGLVGSDGETHQGIFDLSFLSLIPQMTVLAPATPDILTEMLSYAVNVHKGPIAVRYPRGTAPALSAPPFVFGKAAVLREGADLTIAAAGRMVHTALRAAALLEKKNIRAAVIDLRTVKPIDHETVFASAEKTGVLLTLEDNTAPGGIGEKLLAEASRRKLALSVFSFAFPDTFVTHGTVDELMRLYHMDAESVAAKAERMYHERKA